MYKRQGLIQYAVEVSDDAWPYLVRNVTGTALQPVLGDMADALSELDGTVDLVIANPVSYTHLDVYKRQPSPRAR